MGTAAMTDGGDWYLQSIAQYAPKLQFGVIPVPNKTGKNYGAWAGGWSFQLVKGAQHASAATQFLDYLSSSDAAKTFITASQAYSQNHHQPPVLPGGLYFAYPGLVTQYNLPLLKTYPDVLAGVQSFMNAPTTYYKTYARDRNVVSGELWTAEENASQNALLHKMTPRQALTQQNGIIQAAIDSFYK
jgi:ABC-type glycerol-3-phosphate transport system substrate-binding protein